MRATMSSCQLVPLSLKAQQSRVKPSLKSKQSRLKSIMMKTPNVRAKQESKVPKMVLSKSNLRWTKTTKVMDQKSSKMQT